MFIKPISIIILVTVTFILSIGSIYAISQAKHKTFFEGNTVQEVTPGDYIIQYGQVLTKAAAEAFNPNFESITVTHRITFTSESGSVMYAGYGPDELYGRQGYGIPMVEFLTVTQSYTIESYLYGDWGSDYSISTIHPVSEHTLFLPVIHF